MKQQRNNLMLRTTNKTMKTTNKNQDIDYAKHHRCKQKCKGKQYTPKSKISNGGAPLDGKNINEMIPWHFS